MTDNAEHVRALESIKAMCAHFLSDEGRAALIAAIAALKATGWQPIESAPLGDFLVVIKGWVTAAYRNHGEPIKSAGLHEPFVHQPTHWMPLPQPPKESE